MRDKITSRLSVLYYFHVEIILFKTMSFYRKLGMEETLFERLSSSCNDAVITLNLNYRMNKTITDLANILTYGGELQTASDIVANRCLHIPNVEVSFGIFTKMNILLFIFCRGLKRNINIMLGCFKY